MKSSRTQTKDNAKKPQKTPAILTRAREYFANIPEQELGMDRDRRAHLLAYEALLHAAPIGVRAARIVELAGRLQEELQSFVDEFPNPLDAQRQVEKIFADAGMPPADYHLHAIAADHFDPLLDGAEHVAWFVGQFAGTNEDYLPGEERRKMLEAVL